MRIGARGTEAVALAVKLADVDVVAAYPITPQTEIVEKIAQFVADGELDAEFVEVESEHSALSVCIGAAAVGARTFTASCSQGLALMHEVLYIASGFRLPIVMATVNRALSAPLSIHCDHCDSMAERDSGWITIYVESCQEALDSTIQAYRIAEEIRLPVMVCLDGFVLGHMMEPVEVLAEDEASEFAPRRKPPYILDPKRPVTMGAWTLPKYYAIFKKQQEQAMQDARIVVARANEEFRNRFGRSYGDGFVERYFAEDADVVLVTLGSMTGVAREVVDEYRRKGEAVGLVKIRTFRPFPIDKIRESLKHAKVAAVVSRDISLGAFGGAALAEVRSALYDLEERPRVAGFVMGLGGEDISTEKMRRVADKALTIAERKVVERDFEFVS